MKPLFVCYPKCTTCKRAEAWLKQQGVDYELRHIVEANPTAAELEGWIKRSRLPISRFFNTSGILYRSMNLKDRVKSEAPESLLELLSTDGMLVKRPILITEKGVFPGFREAEWAALL
ncbi:MAG: arsenate reductase family protein [Rikenellaceae bacterium]